MQLRANRSRKWKLAQVAPELVSVGALVLIRCIPFVKSDNATLCTMCTNVRLVRALRKVTLMPSIPML